MTFWLTITFFTLLMAALCFAPLWAPTLWRQRCTKTTATRNQLNKAFYLQRLQEIEQDNQQGLLDNLEQAKVELQQSLLADIPPAQAGANAVAQENAAQQRTSSAVPIQGILWTVSGFLLLLILASASYFNVGAFQAEQRFAQAYAQFNDFQQRIEQAQGDNFTPQELEQFALALRQYLQQHPQDAYRWWQLGQVAFNLDKAQQALDSYQKAYQLAPQNLEYQLAYARILMFSADASDNAQGETLLKQVLRQDHHSLDALGLLAFHYFEQEHYPQAIQRWQMMLNLLSAQDNRRPIIERSIKAAEKAIGKAAENSQQGK